MPKITIPALIDMHVHLRQPGGEHKETIASGCAAARAGGFGAVAAMPNTVPPIDSPKLVQYIKNEARGQGCLVYPVAAITVGQKGEALTDFAALHRAGAIAVSDDGLPVQSEALMRAALLRGRACGLPVLAHCEPETEMLARDIFLAGQTGCPVHICHVSTKESVALLRKARAEGVPVTAETAPHYMVPWAAGKMNPPLGDERDVEAIVAGLVDGIIDCIATDHAPHTEQEKASDTPPNGVIGLETALAAVLESLYHPGLMTIEEILLKMRDNPAKILGIPCPPGEFLLDTDCEWQVDPGRFKSKARNTVFPGRTLRGRIL